MPPWGGCPGCCGRGRMKGDRDHEPKRARMELRRSGPWSLHRQPPASAPPNDVPLRENRSRGQRGDHAGRPHDRRWAQQHGKDLLGLCIVRLSQAVGGLARRRRLLPTPCPRSHSPCDGAQAAHDREGPCRVGPRQRSGDARRAGRRTTSPCRPARSRLLGWHPAGRVQYDLAGFGRRPRVGGAERARLGGRVPGRRGNGRSSRWPNDAALQRTRTGLCHRSREGDVHARRVASHSGEQDASSVAAFVLLRVPTPLHTLC